MRLIKAVKKLAPANADVIIDCPPGTTCPMINAVTGSDFCLLVSEPTPFGLNDLAPALAVARELGLPCGVVVNRVGIGDDRVQAFCRENAVPVLAELPDDRRIAEAGSRGEPLVDALPEYRGVFLSILERATRLAEKGSGSC